MFNIYVILDGQYMVTDAGSATTCGVGAKSSLETNTSKKVYLHVVKIFWPIFSRIIKYRVWQTSGNDLQGSTKYFDNNCGRYKTISLGANKLLRTQIFEKKAAFPVKKRFWPIFSRNLEC